MHSRRPIKKHHSSLAQKKESITPLMQGGEAGKNKILSFMRDPAYVPMKEKELVLMMQVTDDRRELFKRCLNDLLSELRRQAVEARADAEPGTPFTRYAFVTDLVPETRRGARLELPVERTPEHDYREYDLDKS